MLINMAYVIQYRVQPKQGAQSKECPMQDCLTENITPSCILLVPDMR
jgi:hypothetical protein